MPVIGRSPLTQMYRFPFASGTSRARRCAVARSRTSVNARCSGGIAGIWPASIRRTMSAELSRFTCSGGPMMAPG